MMYATTMLFRPCINRAAALMCACGLLFAAGTGAAESPADYAGTIPLTPRNGDAMHRIELPQAIYAGVAHADLRDLRVFNAAQELVPYALASERASPPAPGAEFAPPVFPVWADAGKTAAQLDVKIEQREDGSVVSISTEGAKKGKRAEAARYAVAYIVDASKIDSPLVSFTPEWREVPDNYIGTARIETGDDLKEWRPLLSGAPLVFLNRGDAKLTQATFTFPPTRAKYFRIILPPKAPVLTALRAEAPSARPEIRRQTLRVPGRAGAVPVAGEVEFDLGLKAPVDRVRVVVPQPNSLAPVRLDVRPDPRGEWRPVVSTVVYRIVREGQELVSPAIPVPPNPSPRWRAVVDQAGGGFGAAAPELEVSWPVRNLVFLARGQGPFTLAFGKSDALPATLPIATLVPGYREGSEFDFPVAESGAVRTTPPAPPTILSRLPVDADPKKLVLWGALLLGVLLLAAMAWKLSRQMQAGAATVGLREDAMQAESRTGLRSEAQADAQTGTQTDAQTGAQAGAQTDAPTKDRPPS